MLTLDYNYNYFSKYNRLIEGKENYKFLLSLVGQNYEKEDIQISSEKQTIKIYLRKDDKTLVIYTQQLNFPVDLEKITASYKDEILELTISKLKPEKFEVKVQ